MRIEERNPRPHDPPSPAKNPTHHHQRSRATTESVGEKASEFTDPPPVGGGLQWSVSSQVLRCPNKVQEWEPLSTPPLHPSAAAISAFASCSLPFLAFEPSSAEFPT